MRLLSTKTLQLYDDPEVEYDGTSHTFAYAVLSHTWEVEEVSYAEMVEHPSREWLKSRKGGRKLLNFCRIALAQGYEWGWVDTCCIDKRSSAELSEAINSMFSWYEQAAICFAYLCDYKRPKVCSNPGSRFEGSRWFTRGWTLQELLAPRDMVFFDKHWVTIGTKKSLSGNISRATNIAESYLPRYDHFSASIAQRLAWAAPRKTLRPEDKVYCLLGLFEVNMPLLYGEGEEAAFRRFQVEVMQGSDDHSILAWYDSGIASTIRTGRYGTDGTLASNVEFFTGCLNIFSLEPRWSASVIATKRSLHLNGFEFRCVSRQECKELVDSNRQLAKFLEMRDDDRQCDELYMVPIACSEFSQYPQPRSLCLVLVKGRFTNTFFRICCVQYEQWKSTGEVRDFEVRSAGFRDTLVFHSIAQERYIIRKAKVQCQFELLVAGGASRSSQRSQNGSMEGHVNGPDSATNHSMDSSTYNSPSYRPRNDPAFSPGDEESFDRQGYSRYPQQGSTSKRPQNSPFEEPPKYSAHRHQFSASSQPHDLPSNRPQVSKSDQARDRRSHETKSSAATSRRPESG